MTSLLLDLRFAIRGLVARPLFTLVVVLTLGLGIGVNSAIFSLFNQVALRPLPVSAPEQLVNITAPGPRPGSTSNNQAGGRESIFSFPMYRDLSEAQSAFTGIAAHRLLNSNISAGGQTEVGRTALVSGNYFAVLGLNPALGRLLMPHDDRSIGGSQVAVVSHRYWIDRLGGAEDVINQQVVVNGQPLTIVGVAPEGFSGTGFALDAQVFAPITLRWLLQPRARQDHDNRHVYWIYLFARLAPGLDLAAAEERINAPFQRLIAEVEAPQLGQLGPTEREQFLASRIVLEPGARGQSRIAGQASLPMTLMLAASALVLLVACLNIANLMLARGAARAGEFAVRASMGASRRRMLGQMLVEAGLLAMLGAIASLPMAVSTMALLMSQIPEAGASAFSTALDRETFAFTLAIAMGSVLMFGLFPAMQLARTQPMTVLRGDSARSSGGRGAARFRAGLATMQIALSMTFIALAGLFSQSLFNLSRVDYGMQVESLATFGISPERNGYSAEQSARLFDRLEESLPSLPGVVAVTSSLVPLLSGSQEGTDVAVEGFEVAPESRESILFNEVGEDYFRTFGVPLLSGRTFTRADAAGVGGVAIVNRTFAEQHGLGMQAVGKRMSTGTSQALDLQIVGIVEDSLYDDPRGERVAQFYLPRRQNTDRGEMSFYVRSETPPASLLPQLAALVSEIDPDLPVDHLETVPQRVDKTLTSERLVGSLSLAFALLSTLLASIGLYGVMSYTLSQRTRELGLRLALGAAPRVLRAMVFRQVGRLTLVGAVLGLALALSLGHAAQSLLFGLSGHDPGVMAAALAVLCTVALLTGWWPARRAARIDPIDALRHD